MTDNAAAGKEDVCSIIRRERMLLRSSMTLQQCRAIADFLYSKRAIIQSEMETIKAEKISTSAASLLLDFLEKKGSTTATIFVEALRQHDVGLDLLADKLVAKTGRQPDDLVDQDASVPAPVTELKRKFRRLRPTLISSLSDDTTVLHIVDVLYAAEKISEAEKQLIECQQTPRLKSRRLIDTLDTRDDEALKKFMEALRSEDVQRPELAQQILDEQLTS